MAGRTPRVNAREILERLDGVVYEGDVVREWVIKLREQTERALDSMKRNPLLGAEQQAEAKKLIGALKRAEAALSIFEKSVQERETLPVPSEDLCRL